MQIAQQIAGSPVIVHHAGGIAVNAHLVFDLADAHRVARTKAAVVVHQNLRHDEQRHALDAVTSTGGACQHQMDDILRQIMITRRNENLGPRHQVRAVILWYRLGSHQSQIGAALRFCQVHRAGPVAGYHLWQIHRLLRLRAMRMDCGIGAVRQALIHVERHVGRYEYFTHRRTHHIGQTLPAEIGVTIQRRPSTLFHRRKSRFEPGRRAHNTVFQMAALTVAHDIQGRQHITRHAARFFQHRFGKACVQIAVARNICPRDVQHLLQNELQIFHRRIIAGHPLRPLTSTKSV